MKIISEQVPLAFVIRVLAMHNNLRRQIIEISVHGRRHSSQKEVWEPRRQSIFESRIPAQNQKPLHNSLRAGINSSDGIAKEICLDRVAAPGKNLDVVVCRVNPRKNEVTSRTASTHCKKNVSSFSRMKVKLESPFPSVREGLDTIEFQLFLYSQISRPTLNTVFFHDPTSTSNSRSASTSNSHSRFSYSSFVNFPPLIVSS